MNQGEQRRDIMQPCLWHADRCPTNICLYLSFQMAPVHSGQRVHVCKCALRVTQNDGTDLDVSGFADQSVVTLKSRRSNSRSHNMSIILSGVKRRVWRRGMFQGPHPCSPTLDPLPGTQPSPPLVPHPWSVGAGPAGMLQGSTPLTPRTGLKDQTRIHAGGGRGLQSPSSPHSGANFCAGSATFFFHVTSQP